MFNPTKFTGKLQEDVLKNKFKLNTNKIAELRRQADQSANPSIKFWGQRLGRTTMTKSQFEDTLKRLAKETEEQKLKHVERGIKSFVQETKAKEATAAEAAREEKTKTRSLAYRKYLRMKETRGNIRDELARIEAERFGQGGRLINKLIDRGEGNVASQATDNQQSNDQNQPVPTGLNDQLNPLPVPKPPADLPLD